MTRRLAIAWPSARPFHARSDRPIRILAASDEPDPALDHPTNREALGPIDLVVGCGDLPPEQLAFLSDAFGAPLVFVRGNHDRGGPWRTPEHVPEPTDGAVLDLLPGLPLAGLPWPGRAAQPQVRDAGAAWRQALAVLFRSITVRDPWLVFSHVPPQGAGDSPGDPYHVGFSGYRVLMDRLAPPLWLHGHTAPAAGPAWRVVRGSTTLINVTGSVLVEIQGPGPG
jgi:hypothetical protein